MRNARLKLSVKWTVMPIHVSQKMLMKTIDQVSTLERSGHLSITWLVRGHQDNEDNQFMRRH